MTSNKPSRLHSLVLLFAIAGGTMPLIRAADIAIGDVTAALGPDFFFDAAATGGSDNNATTFTRDISGYWTPGSTVTLKGLGWASSSGGTTATSATVTFTDSGADGSFGTGDDVEVGSVTDNLVFTGVAGEFVWDFDSDVVFTATGSALRIRIVGNNNISRKTTSGTTQANVKLSLAGTMVPGGGGGDGVLTEGYVLGGTALTPNGETLFSDRAALGGNDSSTYSTGAVPFALHYAGIWNPGATVSLTGMALPLRTPTSAGTLTFAFYDPGADETFSGTTSEILVGTATGTLAAGPAAASVYYVNFTSPVNFTSLGTGVVVHVTSNASIRTKITTEAGAGGTGAHAYRVAAAGGGGYSTDPVMRTSLAGTASGGAPTDVQTASTGGFWDALTWSTAGGGSVTGGLGETDTAEVGSYREVAYRGVPATEVVKALHLGETGSSGQATLRIASGSLSTTGSLRAGLGAGSNDSFVHIDGGSLHIGGDAILGRFSDSVDGSLIIAGGTFTVAGNLEMGGFTQGGSMLRFHNPGSSPPVAVGGKLVLGRCALDLTFDSGYSHVPGTVVTLATFGSRDGQFVNFRQGEEFNCGPNRFRIAYSQSAISLTALPNWTPPAVRPNIIVLFADDGGYADLSLQGNPKFPTPRIDGLAASGVRFTDHYMTGGVCHPSRCGLLTGTYQQRYGTDGNLGETAAASSGMALSQPTIPRRLQGLGYRTYGIGKWHLGYTVEFHPNVRGFDRWYGMWAGGRSYYDAPNENQVFQDQMTPDFAAENTGYLTDRIGDKTIAFIEEHLASPHAAEPFYIYVSFTAIHAPMDIIGGDPRFARLQSEFGLTASDYQNSSPVFGGSNQSTVDANRYELAAMTLAMDEQVGKVLDKLAAEGLANNTLVVYTNDNGGAGWNSSAGGNYSYNTPLRGYKGSSMTDGSIRVPAAAAWPGTIPAGQTVTEPTIALDWGATFVNAGGTSPAAARNGLDGLDLMPLLRDGTPLPADRVLCWRMGGATGGGSAARMGDWKMLIADPGGAPKLYNLRTGIGENTDLAASQPAILAALQERFLAWEARTLFPLYNVSGTDIDAGIDYWAISGGLRMKTDSTSPLWLSASLRSPLVLSSDFSRAFLIRATETGPHPAGAGVWHGLGDSSNRADFIRAGIDFGSSSLVLAEGKTGQSASAALPSPPTSGFATAVLDYKASTRLLTLTVGTTSVSLALPAGYTTLTQTAMGASAMEGEVTVLRAIASAGMANAAATTIDVSANPLLIDLDFDTEPPFAPHLERSTGLTGFTHDPSALIESLGGGLYRASAPANPGSTSEFFRFQIDQP